MFSADAHSRQIGQALTKCRADRAATDQGLGFFHINRVIQDDVTYGMAIKTCSLSIRASLHRFKYMYPFPSIPLGGTTQSHGNIIRH